MRLGYVYLFDIIAGLDSFLGWLKPKPGTTSGQSSTSPSSPSHLSSVPPSSEVFETRGRLLHSEIRELQTKLSQLEKENHELRQLLKASGDDSRSALLTRQVRVYIVHDICIHLECSGYLSILISLPLIAVFARAIAKTLYAIPSLSHEVHYCPQHST